ncbi:(2Fe-2S)-binding protein [Streptomyces sp. NPDC058373]|uniref:(2Fe-2S)-binding protein n=1 Tax=Streptomyces sp. NPDC058373 TaxID=3346465 RepID=UPI003646370B
MRPASGGTGRRAGRSNSASPPPAPCPGRSPTPCTGPSPPPTSHRSPRPHAPTTRSPPRVLRGNSASALVGALRVLTNQAPDTPHPSVPLVERLLATPPLAGSGAFLHEEGLGIAFTRRSCCLYYRVPAEKCGDCVLRTRTPRARTPRKRTGPPTEEPSA